MPTTILTPSTKDTYVSQGQPTNNYGTSDYLEMRGSASQALRSLVNFDISSITTEILSAKLGLRTFNLSEGGDVTIHDLQAAFVEGSVTWNTQPAFTAAALDTVAIANSTTWYEFDVTNSNFLYGWLLKCDETQTIGEFDFSSKEEAATADRPKLTLIYKNASPTITSPASTTIGTPTSFADELTPNITATLDGYTISKFRVYIYSGANLYFDSGEVTGAAVDYNVPLSAELEYNHTYGVKVSGLDSDGNWTEISAMHYLTCAIGAIDDLATTDVTAGIKIDWSASTAESITGYNIYRSLSTGTGFVLIDTTTAITYTDYKVASGTNYYYTVKVKDGTNESPASNEVNNSVTYTGWYLNGTVLPVKYGSYSRQRRNHSTSREIIGQTRNTVQSEGLGGNILSLTAILTSNTDVNTIEGLLANVLTLHHSAIGQWKVHLTNDPQINDNGFIQEMRLTFEEVE